jgi:hypothetical protein
MANDEFILVYVIPHALFNSHIRLSHIPSFEKGRSCGG